MGAQAVADWLESLGKLREAYRNGDNSTVAVFACIADLVLMNWALMQSCRQ